MSDPVTDSTEFRRRATDLSRLQLEVLQAIQEDLKVFFEHEQANTEMLRDQVKELRIVVMGTDGQNGLRSEIRKHTVELENLKRWQTQFMAIFAVVQLIGVPIAIYIITHLL